MKWQWVKDEWAKCGIDNWLILGNKIGYGWTNKIFHYGGHFIAVMLGRYWFGLPLWLLIPGSVLFGLAYEYFWNILIEKSGASKLDLIANTIGMLSAVLCISVKDLIGEYPYIIVAGFILTFIYKFIKLKGKYKK